MAAEDVKRYLLAHLPAERIMSPGPGATVEEAAASLGVPPERIAKTLALRGPEGPLLVVTAGNIPAGQPAVPGPVRAEAPDALRTGSPGTDRSSARWSLPLCAPAGSHRLSRRIP